jgi:4-hydroxybenzoate polyprenyltransferase
MVIRQKNWLRSFVPQVLGFLYAYSLFWGQHSLVWIELLLSVSTLLGLILTGYWINDWFDQESDQLVGKTNMHAKGHRIFSFVALFVSLALAFFPWLYLPFGPITPGLLLLQIAFYLSYSAPPLRLKEHSTWGPLCDATYAYGLPFVLSAYTFAELWTPELELYIPILLLGLALAIAGLRNIVLHQINDVFFDIQSNTQTLIQQLGTRSTDRLLQLLLSVETVCYSGFLVLASQSYPFFYLLLAAFLGQSVWEWHKRRMAFPKHTLLFQPSSTLPNTYYQIWQPLFLLAVLCANNTDWLWILAVHGLILVPLSTYELLLSIFQKWILIPIKGSLSLIVNYSIWFAFRTIGVDLRKTNQSALDYLRSKFHR